MSNVIAERTRAVVPVTVAAGPKRKGGWIPTLGLLAGALYTLFPVLWVLIASTKSIDQLFSTFTLLPGSGLLTNLHQLSAYRGGEFWEWMVNSALYAGVGGALSALLSGVTGYALAKYRFAGRGAIFNILLAGVLMPPVVLAVPQYLLFAKAGLADSYWSVLLPSVISPYGIYLARIYAAGAIPDDVLEAGRMDGASEWRLFRSVALPMMAPGLVTVFLFQFVAIWNNFLLPFVMLGDDHKFPVTVGLYTLLLQGANAPALYTLVITGALLSVLPLIALFLSLQRFWRLDLLSGAVKS
ncbi:carbohydrate ABC transporter permease [Streptacidiphilus jiangxiensis]|uniref:Multiple sugar transport system permease protein n=1 Tax=Streptacidiphilus jiangxiensis TaxID=235985 RepID=A0A1H7XVH5_STRJI|nr:carbohydrate ABC transporter permease [Streptacidiphilus jiangxiensis]SEM37158.1 multiple sugar transport system permease protein [Streptacidiphilus jiangxiensis]